MAASSVPPKRDIVALIEDVEAAGVRFVYFSPRNMRRSKVDAVVSKLFFPACRMMYFASRRHLPHSVPCAERHEWDDFKYPAPRTSRPHAPARTRLIATLWGSYYAVSCPISGGYDIGIISR